jgi:hypothetical protein
MLMTIIFLAAAILVYALYRKRDVKFSLRLWGANVLLEARGISEPKERRRP